MVSKPHPETLTLETTLSLPIIFSVFIPLVIADIWSEIYHRTCFPLYGIPYVKRSDYIVIDRHKLSRLNLLAKIGCVYCGYANGWIMYIQEIAARTETCWCAIVHQSAEGNRFPKHHENFLERKEFE